VQLLGECRLVTQPVERGLLPPHTPNPKFLKPVERRASHPKSRHPCPHSLWRGACCVPTLHTPNSQAFPPEGRLIDPEGPLQCRSPHGTHYGASRQDGFSACLHLHTWPSIHGAARQDGFSACAHLHTWPSMHGAAHQDGFSACPDFHTWPAMPALLPSPPPRQVKSLVAWFKTML